MNNWLVIGGFLVTAFQAQNLNDVLLILGQNKEPGVTAAVDKSTKKYLGQIKDGKGAVLYHVETVFYTVQAAAVLHGHSRVRFFNKSWKLLAQCEVGMSDELPKKLVGNSLCFNYVSANNQHLEHRQLIGSVLPKQLCVEPNSNCYMLYFTKE